jgi:hypothetical protein
MSERPDLAAELWQAQQAMRGNPAYMRRIRDLGFNHVSRRCCGHPGVSGVLWHEHRGDALTYEPCGDGANDTAIIIPILDNGIEDLIAWHPKSGRLASRTGTVFALGESWLSGDCESVKVFSDPSEWWRACVAAPVALWPDARLDRDLTEDAWPYSPLDRFWWHPPGLVVIDWNDARHRLGHVKRLIADCLTLGERLEKAIQPIPPQIPKIFLDTERLAA